MNEAAQPDRAESRARMILAGAGICALALAAYWPALRAGFVWDDDSILTQNPLIKAADGLRRFWFTTQPADYWPVTNTSFWLEWRLWGLHAAGYHATNLALHIGESLLLWAVLRQLGLRGAYLAAMLFAVHPVNVESVAWIAERKNLLAMLFYLLSIWFFLRDEFSVELTEARRLPPRGGSRLASVSLWYWLSLMAFVLAMLSKASIAMLPLVLAGIVRWRRPWNARDVYRLVPFFAFAAALAALSVWFQGHQTNEVIRSAGWAERLAGAGMVIWFYLGKALMPVGLIFVYPLWRIHAEDPTAWLPLAAAVLATWLLWRFSRRGWYGWGYFCVSLVPVMGFTDVYFMKYSLVADHYQHVAIIGILALVAAGWSEVAEVSAGLARCAAAIAVCGLAVLTWQQCRIYHDPVTFYQAILARNPDCWMAEGNLGNWYEDHGDSPRAIAHYDEALRLKPDYAEMHSNLGMAWLKTPGRADAAVGEFEEALRLKPNFAKAHFNLGFAWQKMPGRLGEAIAEYETALRLQPDYAEAHFNLGNAWAAIPGRMADAVAQYEAALRLDPNLFEAHLSLGSAWENLPGKLHEAIAEDQAALRLRPDDPEAHFNLGNAWAKTPGRLDHAIAQYEEALRLRADYAEAHFNLAVVLLKVPGRRDEAQAHLEAFARLRPDSDLAERILARLRASPP